MSYVIKLLVSLTPAPEFAHEPRRTTDSYLTFFDPDGGDSAIAYPTGVVKVTPDIEHAKRFDTVHDALRFTRQQAIRTPLRPDGKPNRPLTAFTFAIERADAEEVNE